MISRILFTVLAVIYGFAPIFAATSDDAMINSVLKIKTYEYNSIDGTYSLSHYGSAVLIDGKRIITNAHVVLDSNGIKPTGFYEICRTVKNKKFPVCFSTGKLTSYDSIADIALLELSIPITNVKGASFSTQKQLSIGSSIVVYGYPAIGGTSITRTEGKIGGMEDDTYKFDGTIDHGNSGGGAFSADGKLIGLPAAVKSDNGIIGYIIPTTIINSFLAGKTNNFQKYQTPINTTFVKYISNTQGLYKNGNSIKTKVVEINNAEKNGFTLVDSISSVNGDIFFHYFADSKNRVNFSVSCTKDSSITWNNYLPYNQDFLLSQQKYNSKVVATGKFLDAGNNIYFIESLDAKSTKGEKKLFAVLLDRRAPTCNISIVAQDGSNKDKASYDKAVAIAKSIKINSNEKVQRQFVSPFFTINRIPDNVYLSQDFSNNSTIPFFGIKLPSGNMVSSTFTLMKFENLSDYMSLGFSEKKEYKGTNFTFEEFLNRYKSTIYSNVYDATLYSDNNKPIIMTLAEYGEKTGLNTAFEKQITFFYPFQTAEGEYRGYKFDFMLNTTDDADNFALRQVFESMILPGNSPFTK